MNVRIIITFCLVFFLAAILVGILAVHKAAKSKSATLGQNVSATTSVGVGNLPELPTPSFRTVYVKYRGIRSIAATAREPASQQEVTIEKYIDATSNKYYFETVETATFNGVKVSRKTGQLYDGSKLYVLDLDQSTATPYDLEFNSTGLPAWMDGFLERGTHSTGQEMISGRTCNVFKIKNHMQCVWSGLVLKEMRESSPSKETIEAVEIKVNEVIPDAKLALSEDFNVAPSVARESEQPGFIK